ncbi:MAG: renalase [Planctomycetota bacterium]|jgi:renalase
MTNEIAIIGAGLSGLAVANILKEYADITLFEKARGVSGRMSTRQAEPYLFDHGAQFFKARTDEFKAFIDPMIQEGVIARWDARFVEIVDREVISKRKWGEELPYYVGLPGMNAIAKHLGQGLDIQLGTRVQSMKKQQGKWNLADGQGNALGDYDWVISTIPAEQAVELLPSSLPCHSTIRATTMKGCFSLMLGFEHVLPLEFDAALVRGEDISWISVNSSKPGRNDAYCLLVHSTNKWADEHIEDDRDKVMEYLCQQTGEIIGYAVNAAEHKAIHGWRYAYIEKQSGDSHFIDCEAHVGVCGDWLVQGRVEAAFTSGFGLANKVLMELQGG